MKSSQNQARFLYYTWDSLKNFNNSQEKLVVFDKAYSFDRSDCVSHPNVNYLPLFYTRSYEKLGENSGKRPSKYDLLILGSIHSDRYAVAKNILSAVKQVATSKITSYIHFFYQSRWVFFLQKLFNVQFKSISWNEVSWLPLNVSETTKLLDETKIVIDIHHPRQVGLTMRTIECIGARKKMITTNLEVRNHDFYCAENFLVVDRVAPVVPHSFLIQPYKKLETSIYEKYSLRRWLNEIFS